jgi:hypothetical protein
MGDSLLLIVGGIRCVAPHIDVSSPTIEHETRSPGRGGNGSSRSDGSSGSVQESLSQGGQTAGDEPGHMHLGDPDLLGDLGLGHALDET